MLNFGKSEGPRPRCLFTNNYLSSFIDHDRPPTKKQPFSTFSDQTFSHTLDLLLPEPAASSFQSAFISNASNNLIYAKVHMKLQDLIAGDVFNSYIKASGSNILMLSEGRAGVDHVFSLQQGLLRLEVDKPTFERTGLEGQAIPTEGRKHVKARFAINLDLRQPSMVHGKKGFERVVWAFKNVLDQAVTWLFVDLRADGEAMVNGPITEFAPSWSRAEVDVQHLQNALVPAWPTEWAREDCVEAADLLEWISLAMIVSPRLRADDLVDPYLCRYQMPSISGEAKEQHLVRFRWRGLVHPSFVQKALLSALKAAGNQWLALSAIAFDAAAYTILIHDGQCASWQYQD